MNYAGVGGGFLDDRTLGVGNDTMVFSFACQVLYGIPTRVSLDYSHPSWLDISHGAVFLDRALCCDRYGLPIYQVLTCIYLIALVITR
jgi:hypothetical protein